MQYGFVGASVFVLATLMATSSHSFEFWKDRLLELLGTQTYDTLLLAESIILSLIKSINSANRPHMIFCIVGFLGLKSSSSFPRAHNRWG
jgi:hypothetical protein